MARPTPEIPVIISPEIVARCGANAAILHAVLLEATGWEQPMVTLHFEAIRARLGFFTPTEIIRLLDKLSALRVIARWEKRGESAQVWFELPDQTTQPAQDASQSNSAYASKPTAAAAQEDSLSMVAQHERRRLRDALNYTTKTSTPAVEQTMSVYTQETLPESNTPLRPIVKRSDGVNSEFLLQLEADKKFENEWSSGSGTSKSGDRKVKITPEWVPEGRVLSLLVEKYGIGPDELEEHATDFSMHYSNKSFFEPQIALKFKNWVKRSKSGGSVGNSIQSFQDNAVRQLYDINLDDVE